MEDLKIIYVYYLHNILSTSRILRDKQGVIPKYLDHVVQPQALLFSPLGAGV